jgi:hypothetical protein
MKMKLICSFLLFMSILALDCTNLAGGNGSETTNGYVVGKLLQDDGKPAMNTKVMLVTSNYDPVKNGPIADSLIDTTDESGSFKLRATDGELFNIEAFQPATGNRILLNDISVPKNDTNDIATHVLKKTGKIKCLLPFVKDSVDGYIYLPGTTRFAEVENGKALIDSVPAGYIAVVSYSEGLGANKDSVIASDITVAAGNTTVIENTSVWKYSKTFHLNTTGSGADVAGNVTNFPVLIRLTNTNFDFSQTRVDGADLKFAKESGAPLPYEIERWDSGAQQAEVWVNIDTIYGNDDSHSYLMCWGNPSAVSASDGKSVFDTSLGFTGVWHLGETGNSNVDGYADATPNCANGQGTNMSAGTETQGIIGRGQNFQYSLSQYITIKKEAEPKFEITGDITVSAWINVAAWNTKWQAIITKGDNSWRLHRWNENGSIEFVTEGPTLNTATQGTTNISTGTNTWYYITGVYDGNNLYMYCNGISDTVPSPANGPDTITTANVMIGENSDSTGRYFNGIIDEVRVEKAARNADWVRLCYMNQRQQDALVKW